MGWESTVNDVTINSRVQDAFTLAEDWNRLGAMLANVAWSLGDLAASTRDDATGSSVDLPANYHGVRPTDPTGHSWTGLAAEAFRARIDKMATFAADTGDRSTEFGRALHRCGDYLTQAIASIPVPLFYDRDLPGGTDAEDVLVAGGMDAGRANRFARLIREDRGQAGRYYEEGGFKKRLDEAVRFSADGVAFGGKAAGDSPEMSWTEALGFGDKAASATYVKNRDRWIRANSALAEAARAKLAEAYVSDGPVMADNGVHIENSQTIDNSTSVGTDPTHQESTGGDSPTPMRSSLMQGRAAYEDRKIVSHQSDPRQPEVVRYGALPSNHIGSDPNQLPVDSVQPDAPLGHASGGLAGIGNGYTGVAPSSGGIASRGSSGGIPVNLPNSVPGLVVPGSASSGSDRSPMSPVTSARKAFAEYAAGRGGGSMSGGVGAISGAGGPNAGGSSDRAKRNSWLREDEDVWGLAVADNLPPMVIGSEYYRSDDDDEDDEW